MSTHVIWRLILLSLILFWGGVIWAITAIAAPTPDPAPWCRVVGSGSFTAPDNACTPGAYRILSRAAVCTSKDRPSLPAADRREVLGGYGVPGWKGTTGELDHRVPVFLGGLTVEDNIWPERGPIPNAKDRLESLVRRRICVDHTMRVRTAVRLFLADWRPAYRALVPSATT